MPAKKGGAAKKNRVKKIAKPSEPVAPPAPMTGKDLIAPYYQTPRLSSARTAMWIGALSCAAIIIMLWGYSVKVRLGNIEWQRSAEESFISETKRNWDESFAEQKNNADSGAASVRTEINALVTQLLNATGSRPTGAAPSATSTPAPIASSTP